jgi:hypothetical protein
MAGLAVLAQHDGCGRYRGDGYDSDGRLAFYLLTHQFDKFGKTLVKIGVRKTVTDTECWRNPSP